MQDGHMDAKVLRRAAEIVEQGWCQGDFHLTATGERTHDRRQAAKSCLAGALHIAADEIFGRADAHEWREERWVSVVPHGLACARWNDAPGRTADEVAAALRAAADRCDGASPERSEAR